MLITPARAIADPNLMARGFRGTSWDRWRAILKAAYGEPLTDTEHRMFTEVAERDPPTCPVRELWVVGGRRGGKDSVASAIAATAALGDFTDKLRPGELATVMCLACDRFQARIVLNYVKGYFRDNPLLSPLVRYDRPDGLELTNNIEVTVATNSYRAVRGRTVLCAIFDEVAYWRDERFASPDFEVYNAVAPGLVTLPGSMLIGISTAYRRAGLLFDKWRRHYGTDDPDVLVIRATSQQLNPLVPQADIDRAFERDPEAAAAEWLSEWRSDIADYISREVVEAAVTPGCRELPFLHEHAAEYLAFTDPSGGSGDSFTLAIAHREGERGVLDCVREVRPPFSPEAVVDEFAEVLKSYHCHKVTGDRYGGEFPRELFQKRGVTYEPSERTKSDLYRELLPLLNSRKVELLDNPRLVTQLCSLERRTGRGTGRDSIDHPPGAHDDVANAAAGALVLAGAHDELRIWRILGRAAA